MVRRDRQAFTLVEILIVIGIILLLIAIGVIGFQHIDKVASERSTKATLESVTAIMNAYETNAGSLATVEGAGGSSSTYTAITGSPAVFISANPQSPIISQCGNPGDVNFGSAGQQSQAVTSTATIMGTFSRVPECKSIIAQMPPASILNVATANSTPVIVDAWRNPIIYVPATGLPAVNVTTGGGQVQKRVVAADGRPFWASAGQDGNFSNGDDNIYSKPVVYLPYPP